MNIEVARHKSTLLDPAADPEHKTAALAELTEIAGIGSGPKSVDAQFVLKELGHAVQIRTDAVQPATLDTAPILPPSTTLPAQVDAELQNSLDGAKYDDWNKRSPEAELYWRLLSSRLLFDEMEHCSGLLTLHRSSHYSAIRQKAFRAVAWLAYAGGDPLARKTAMAYLASLDISQQVLECGGVDKLADVLLFEYARTVSNPLERADEPLVNEAARRTQLYERSLYRRVLPADFLSIPVADLGTPKGGGTVENIHELVFLFGCPEKSLAVPA